jgi:AraC-like DNA-binding protein
MSTDHEELLRRRRRADKRRALHGPARLPVDPTLSDLAHWVDRGWTLAAIARAGDLSYRGVHGLWAERDQRHTTHWSIAARIRQLTQERLILAQPATAPVPATGTRRRVQGLAARGWPMHMLAGQLHLSPQGLSDLLVVDAVQARTHTRVTGAHDLLADRDGPDELGAARARGRGWLHPWMWDEQTIEDPDHDPLRACGEDAREERLDQVLAASQPRCGRGRSSTEIASDVGFSVRQVDRDRVELRRRGLLGQAS